MCKKLIYLVSFILVLGFVLPSIANAADPNADLSLVGWWKFDGDANDSSGNDHHGTLKGNAHCVSGVLDQAVELDGSGGYVVMSGYKGILGAQNRTCAAWIKTEAGGVIMSWGSHPGGDQRTGRKWIFEVIGNGRLRVFLAGGNVQSSTRVKGGKWRHVAAVLNGNKCDDINLYVDGILETRTVNNGDVTVRTGIPGDPNPANVQVGRKPFWGVSYDYFDGLIDDVRLYDRALSEDEVQHLADPARAYNPSPIDGALDVPVSAKLTWSPGTDESTGSEYTKHDVYFSTNFEDVNAGTVTPIRIDDGNEHTPALDYYNYYYWRVDEVNDSNEAYRGYIWSFKATYNPALVDDPNLLAWYEFDGDATDSSGYGCDLTEFGEPAYTDGFEDQAINLDGIDDHAVYSFPTEDRNDYTVTVWVRANTLGQSINSSVFSSHRPNTNGFQLDVDGTNPGNYRYNDGFNKLLGPVTTGWVHLAVACDGTRTTLYYNGSHVDVNSLSDLAFSQYAVGINRNYQLSKVFDGAVDEVRIYDYELDNAEIVVLMRIDLARAWMPNPGDGATGVAREPTLSWNPGDYAPGTNGHKVYFGADDPGNMVLVSTPAQPQTPNNFEPGGLDLGRTYYWKVNEVNVAGGVNPGKIWSFTVVNYMVVDDFDSYPGAGGGASDPCMWEAWLDGAGDCDGNDSNSGAILYTESSTTYGGSTASMRYVYDNDGTVEIHPCVEVGGPLTRPWYSRGVAQIAGFPSGIDPNWLAGGAKALSLQFNGEPNNTIELLWVELGDTDANKAKVFYGAYDDEDPNDFNDGAWHEWNIALSDFTGVDVTSVNDITIGIGDEGAASPGETGILYVDDIRLYPPRCLPLRLSADFAKFDYAPTGPGGDCVIDDRELDVMFDDWLDYDYTIYATAPGDANLVGHWEFEGDFNDSSVNGHDGDPCGSATIVPDATRDSNVLSLNGVDDYVDITDYNGITGPNAFSITAWINTHDDEGEIMGWGSTATGATRVEFRINDDRLRCESAGNVQGDTSLPNDEWLHVAVTVKAGATISYPDVKLYLNGADDTIPSTDESALGMVAGHSVKIGRRHSDSERWLDGLVDDVRIYDKELSQGEILSIAGIAEVYYELTSVANVYDEELKNLKIVNFLDYALLAERWLDGELWP